MKSFGDMAAEVTQARSPSKPVGDVGGRQQSIAGHCSAYGCPRAGSLSQSTRGDSSWWCWEHFAALGRNESLQAITADIHAGLLPEPGKLQSAWCEENRHLVKRGKGATAVDTAHARVLER